MTIAVAADLPVSIPMNSSHFSPYTQAVLATLAGAYRPSKRQIQQLAGDLSGLPISTGMISKLERQSAAALEAPYNELAVAVHTPEVIHVEKKSLGLSIALNFVRRQGRAQVEPVETAGHCHTKP